MTVLFRRRGEEVPPAEWSPALAREVALLGAQGDVELVGVRAVDDGATAILLHVDTAVSSEPPATDIRPLEPVALVYRAGAVGVTAPTVFSDREDFPRDLTHLNPVPDDSPVSICLAREGLQPLYERAGVGGVVERLGTWFRDALAGTLNHDGWEPIPVSSDPALGIVDGARVQNFIHAAGDDPGWAWGVAALVPSGEACFISAESLVAGEASFAVATNAMKHAGIHIPTGADQWPAPVIVLWQSTGTTEHRSAFRKYVSLDQLSHDLDLLGLKEKLVTALRMLAFDAWNPPRGKPCRFVLIVGVRRPEPIIQERLGLAADLAARSVELKAFFLETASRDALRDREGTVREIALMPAASRELLAEASGGALKQAPCLIGCGALGSEIGLYLLRMGTDGLIAIDADQLLAHNLARHAGLFQHVARPKADVLAQLAASLYPLEAVTVHPIAKKLEDLTAEDEQRVRETSRFIIDATASDPVRRRLPLFARRTGKRVVRVELFNRGTLGVEAVEGEGGNPDILDLYYALCAAGLTNDDVSTWLRHDERDYDPNEVILGGFSCASATVRLPQWKVAHHAASFMATIVALGEGRPVEAGLGLNQLDDQGRAAPWQWHPVAPFNVVDCEDGWQVRVAADVLTALGDERRKHLPDETGGYLYGGFDVHLRRVTVVCGSPEPPGTRATPTALELGRAGHTAIERDLKRRCGGRLELVGAWHSHPTGDASLSKRDRATIAGLCEANHERALPTLAVVSAEGGDAVYLLL